MPLSPGLESRFRQSISNEILSRRELDRLGAQLRTREDATWLADQLRQHIGRDALELRKFTRRTRLDAFLGVLDRQFDLGLDPTGVGDRIDALLAARGNEPVGSVGPADPASTALPRPAPGGSPLEVDGQGRLQLDGEDVTMGHPRAAAALAGLLDPGQLDSLPSPVVQALLGRLVERLERALPLDAESTGKLGRMGEITAAAAVLSGRAEALGAELRSRAGALAESAPSPMVKALLRAAGGWAPAEGEAELLDLADSIAGDRLRIDGVRAPRSARSELLSILGFARNQDAVDNVLGGLAAYGRLDPQRGLGATGLARAREHVARYVDAYPQTSYVFGTFSGEAPKRVAELTNAELVAELEPGLQGQPPRFGETPLSPRQVGFMKSVLAGLADRGAAEAVERALAEAADVFSGRMRPHHQRPPRPSEPLAPAAFALFERLALPALEARSAEKNGMMAALGLADRVEQAARPLGALVAGAFGALRGAPPRFVGSRVTPEAARWLESLLKQRMASELSIDNLAHALEHYAGDDGRVSPDELASFRQLVERYASEFPEHEQLDFNKLPRVASYAVQGKSMPANRLNGRQVGLSGLDRAVASAVASAAAAGEPEYAWMAERWAFRAKAATHLLDVIAQQTAEGAGPVHALRAAHPGREVSIAVTGASGAHAELGFEVEGVGRFHQGSDGRLEPVSRIEEPVLARARVLEGGALDVEVADVIDTERWPLQTTYAVGDSIDVFHRDRAVDERWEEGEEFETGHQVLEGRIEGFDARGTYAVRVELPGGREAVRRLSIREMERANNPHAFDLRGSRFSDVSIDVDAQPRLAAFIEGAGPIIAEHFPSDGSLRDAPTELIAKRQKDCVAALLRYTNDHMKYPAAKDERPDPASKAYHQLIDGLGWYDTAPLGKLLELERGVCRHQCIALQLLLQVAGVDSRLASGAANTRSGTYRGLHIWNELALAVDSRFLSDATWNDVAIPLWGGAYDVDARRIEMYHRTARYDAALVG